MTKAKQYPGRDLNPQDTRVSGDFESADTRATAHPIEGPQSNNVQQGPDKVGGDHTPRRTRVAPLSLGQPTPVPTNDPLRSRTDLRRDQRAIGEKIRRRYLGGGR